MIVPVYKTIYICATQRGYIYATIDVLTRLLLKIQIFRVVTPCRRSINYNVLVFRAKRSASKTDSLWRWRHYDHLKCLLLFTNLQDGMSSKTLNFSDLTEFNYLSQFITLEDK